MLMIKSLCDVVAESYRRWHCRGDLAMAQCRCRVMLVMALLRQLGHGKMSMLNHAGDGAVKS
jgi:hypothetical protein